MRISKHLFRRILFSKKRREGMAARSLPFGDELAKPTGNGSVFDNLGRNERVNAEHLPAWRAHLCAGLVVRVKAIEHRSSY